MWSFLLFSGYLTTAPGAAGKTPWGEPLRRLTIPNQEVLFALRKLVTRWTEKQAGGGSGVADMLEGLVRGNEDAFASEFTNLVRNVLSFHDVRRRHSESVMHAFVTGLVVHLSESHHVRSNRESGYGRYDVMLEPKDPKAHAGVVMEFKVAESKEDLQEVLASAHAQIEEKKYAAELEARGCTRVLRWAIAFKGKDVEVSLRG